MSDSFSPGRRRVALVAGEVAPLTPGHTDQSEQAAAEKPQRECGRGECKNNYGKWNSEQE